MRLTEDSGDVCKKRRGGEILLKPTHIDDDPHNATTSDVADQPGVYTALPLKPCRRVGCSALVRGGGYCDKHRRTDQKIRRDTQGERGRSGEWHGLYYTTRWREMRAVQLITEPYCRECGRHGVRVPATDVDHIVPHRGNKRLFYDATNLQSLCHSCHSRKTIAEQSTFTSRPV